MNRLVLLLCLALAACAPRPAHPPVLAPVSEASLLARVAASAEGFHSLRGLAKVRVIAEGRAIGGTQVLLVEKPDRLRAETLSPFGQPLLVLATDGCQLAILAPGEGRFYQGPATSRNVERFTHLPLRLPDLVSILLYQVPLIGEGKEAMATIDDGRYRLSLQDTGERRQELFFDGQERLVEADYYAGGQLELKVSWGRFTSGPQPFPQAATLSMPRQQTEASVSFSELKTNVAIPAERFVLSPPAGVAVLPLP